MSPGAIEGIEESRYDNLADLRAKDNIFIKRHKFQHS